MARKTARKRVTRVTKDTVPTVVLSIDPAASSGWAIWLHQDLHSSGTATTAAHRREVVDTCWDLVEDPAEIWVVMEKSTFGTKATVFGMGRAHGQWLEQLELAQLPWDTKKRLPRNCTQYSPSQWRRRLWGSLKMKGNKEQRRAGWKIQALTWAKSYHQVDCKTDDQAEAICLGEAHRG